VPSAAAGKKMISAGNGKRGRVSASRRNRQGLSRQRRALPVCLPEAAAWRAEHPNVSCFKKARQRVSAETSETKCFNCFKLRFRLFLSSPMLYNLPGTFPGSSAGLVGFRLVTLPKS
jgi:hypothetical protein